MNKVLIFADGASKGNPGPGGWGAIVGGASHVRELGGREAHTTNNKMELRAALEALTYARELSPQSVELYTDSSYVINGITKWVHGWKKNGWQTKEKKEVLNRELWSALDEAVSALGAKIEWKYVGGHIGIVGNERVDAIASNFAEETPVELYDGSRADYTIDLANIAHDEELQATKSASKSRSRGKAYSYISKVDGKIVVHKTWAECEARVRGKKARFKKATSPAEEAEIIKDFSK